MEPSKKLGTPGRVIGAYCWIRGYGWRHEKKNGLPKPQASYPLARRVLWGGALEDGTPCPIANPPAPGTPARASVEALLDKFAPGWREQCPEPWQSGETAPWAYKPSQAGK